MSIALDQRRAPVRRRFDPSMPLLAVLGLFLCALVLLPLLWLAWYSITDAKGALTAGNFIKLASDPSFVSPFLTALAIALSVAIASCVVATPLAWLVSRTDMPQRQTILFDIYTVEGVTFAIACYAFPYVFVLVANALDRIPADLEDASAILGGSRAATLRRVVLPLVLPALLAGALVAFLQSLTLFGTPAILALPAGFHVITTKIWSLFQYPPNPHLAAAAALPLLLVTIVLLRGRQWLLGRRSYAVIGGKSGASRLVALGAWRWPALVLALAIIAMPVLLPYAALLKTAMVRTASEPLTWESLTLHNIHFVFIEFSQTQLALRNTFLLGLLAATAGTLLALVVSYLTARRLVVGHQVLGFLATAPIAIPGIVLGVGLFLSYSRPPVVLYGTLWILLIAFLTIELPAGYQQLQAAIGGLHPELEEASRIFGATRLRSLWQITAPLLRTSVVATWCFIFIGVIRELSATIMLTTAQTKLVSVIIYDLNESGDLGAISVLGITLLLITFVVVLVANRLPVLGRAAPPLS
jgi:iron(III) transport system permease protein